jgi:hypothetical protein
MPYCVNCGVELAASEPRCPLCQTEVMLADYQADSGVDPFPRESDPHLPPKINASLVLLISVLVIISAIITVTVDLAVSPGLTWSPVVLASLGLFWMLSAFPLILIRRRPFYTIALMALASAAFLLLLDLLMDWSGWSIVASSALIITVSIFLVPFKIRIGRGIPAALVDGALIGIALFLIEQLYAEGSWFMPLGLPLAILSALFLATVSYMIPLVRRRPYRFIPAILLVIGSYNVGIEVIINHYTQVISRGTSWSIYVLISLMIPSLLIYYLGRNRRLRHNIKKRLHL